MPKSITQKLIDEEFGGKNPTWRSANWGGAKDLSCTENNENWYFDIGGAIIVQDKEMKDAPHCYECHGPINYVDQRCSVHFAEFSPAPVGGGDVITRRIPYCPNCQPEPASHDIVTETVEETFARESR